jgi:adenylate cyclase
MTRFRTHHAIAQAPFSEGHQRFPSLFRAKKAVNSINGHPANAMAVNAKYVPVGNVLIAMADFAGQESLHQVLTAAGYVVRSLSAGQDVLEAVRAGKPDVLLLSTQLSEGNSFDICAQVKADSATAGTLVIFTGPETPKGDRLKAFAAGALDFLPEPIWPEELVARIQTHLTHDRIYRRVQVHAQKMLSGSSPSPLLATLQRTLNQQTRKLQEKNQLLETEIQERQEIEQALRREQQKSEQLLLNILPQAIVTQLKQFEGSLAKRFDKATVLFADIVGFTTIATAMKPLELVDMLNQIFSAFDRLAEKYGLEKIKTIGDAYMVVGGLPVPSENHAKAVVEMALEMQTVVQDFTRPDGQPLQLRIGVNTGSVVAGVIGIKKFSYDLWGDTVNVASRMESQGVPGKIQVTGATYQELRDEFDFEPWGEMLIKGKGYMPIYHLLGHAV